jgi:hypothetical protein
MPFTAFTSRPAKPDNRRPMVILQEVIETAPNFIQRGSAVGSERHRAIWDLPSHNITKQSTDHPYADAIRNQPRITNVVHDAAEQLLTLVSVQTCDDTSRIDNAIHAAKPAQIALDIWFHRNARQQVGSSGFSRFTSRELCSSSGECSFDSQPFSSAAAMSSPGSLAAEAVLAGSWCRTTRHQTFKFLLPCVSIVPVGEALRTLAL